MAPFFMEVAMASTAADTVIPAYDLLRRPDGALQAVQTPFSHTPPLHSRRTKFMRTITPR